MKPEDIDKRLQEIEKERLLLAAEYELKSHTSNLNRARSITVGTAFNGVTEVSMRGEGRDFMWLIMQPVEVIELIHQLAGNIGCHINLQPRKDFASWRDWKVTEEEKLHLNGWAPHPNDMLPHMNVGNGSTDVESLPGLNNKENLTRNPDEPLAIKKSINKRKSKRTAASS